MKIIACHSNKGGVRKTAAPVNLAYAVAASGMRTLFCDLNSPGGVKGAVPTTVMIDATYLKAHRTATSLRSKKGGQAAKGASAPGPWRGPA